jgi:hypothetical protein
MMSPLRAKISAAQAKQPSQIANGISKASGLDLPTADTRASNRRRRFWEPVVMLRASMPWPTARKQRRFLDRKREKLHAQHPSYRLKKEYQKHTIPRHQQMGQTPPPHRSRFSQLLRRPQSPAVSIQALRAAKEIGCQPKQVVKSGLWSMILTTLSKGQPRRPSPKLQERTSRVSEAQSRWTPKRHWSLLAVSLHSQIPQLTRPRIAVSTLLLGCRLKPRMMDLFILIVKDLFLLLTSNLNSK